MATNIEKEVVSLEFDNSKFDSKVIQSQKTLNAFKSAFNMDKSTASMNNLQNTANKFSISGLTNGVNNVTRAFSAMDVVFATTIANITNKAVNAGTKIAKALTIEPVKMGFQEYETQINAIQTILANTSKAGTTLDDVTAALDELNTYADKTIYNFTEMTRNIGTFTAAGITLETSTDAIKGIANLAAVSGSNAQQASTAMYQLSQALAAGRVTLMDWNSVVNAGMGGKVFQDALIETSELMGTGAKKYIEAAGSFRDSLSEQWITTDVLTETLAKFTGDLNEAELAAKGYTQEQIEAIIKMGITANDAATKVKTFTQLIDTLKEAMQSGWTNTWELLIGDFDEAKELFTYISDNVGEVIGRVNDSRNKVLSEALGSSSIGLTKYMQILKQVDEGTQDLFINAIKDAAKEHGVAIDEMIEKEGSLAQTLKEGWLSADILNEAVDAYNKGTSKIAKDFTDLEPIVKDVMNGMYGNGADRKKTITDMEKDYTLIQNVVNAYYKDRTKSLTELLDQEAKALGYTEEQTVALEEMGKAAEDAGLDISDLIKDIDRPSGRENLLAGFKNILDSVINTVNVFSKCWDKSFGITADDIYEATVKFRKFTEAIKIDEERVKQLYRIFDGVFSVIKVIADTVSTVLKDGLDMIIRLFGMANVDGLELLAVWGDTAKSMSRFAKDNNVIVDLFKKLYTAIEYTVIHLRDLVNKIKEFGIQSGVFDSITTAFYNLAKSATTNLRHIKDFIVSIGGLKNISIGNLPELFDLVSASATDMWNCLKMPNLGIDKLVETFNTMPSKLKAIQYKIESAFELDAPVSAFVDSIVDPEGLDEDSVAWLDNITSSMDKAFTRLKEIFTFDFSQAAALVGGITIIGIAAAFYNILNRIVGVLTSFGTVATKPMDALASLTGVLTGVTNMLKSFSLLLKASAILAISAAIFVFVGAMYALSRIEPGRLYEVAAALFASGVLLAGFGFIINKSPLGSKSVFGISAVIISLAASIVLLIGVYEKLTQMPRIQDLDSFASAILFISAFVLAVYKMKETGIAKAQDTVILLAGLAGSVFIMCFAFEKLAKLDMSTESVGAILLGTVAMIALFSSTLLAAKDESAASMLSLVGVVSAIWLLLNVLEGLAAKDTAFIMNGMRKMTPVFIATIALLFVVSKTGPNANKAGLALLAISSAMVIATAALSFMSLITPSTIQKASAALATIIGVYSVIIVFTKFAGENAHKAAATILAMSVAISVTVASLAFLTLINMEKMQESAIALGSLMVILCLAIAATYGVKEDAVKTIGVLGGVIAIMGGTIGALSYFTDDAVMSAIALSLVLGVTSAAVFALSKVKKAQSAMIPLLVMSAAVAIIGVILLGMSTMGVENGLENALALSAIIGVLTLCMGPLALLGGGPQAIYAIAGAAALITIGAMLAIAVPAMLSVMGDLYGGRDSIAKGLDLISMISIGMGEAIGGFISGVIEGLMPCMKSFGTGLSEFAVAASPFFVIMSTINGWSVLSNTVMIIAAMSLFGVAGFASAFMTAYDSLFKMTNNGDSPLTKFAKGLVPFGTSFMEFVTSLDDLTTVKAKKIEIVANAVHTLMDSIPITDGIVEWLMGSKDIENFSEGLTSYGTGLKSFCDEVNGLDTDGVDEAVSVTGKLADMAKLLPNDGGWLGTILGENDMAAFGGHLKAYAKKFVPFCEKIAGIEVAGLEEKADVAISVTGKFAEMATGIGNTGGYLATWIGDNKLSDFGVELGLFGDSFNTLMTTLSGFKDTYSADAESYITHVGDFIDTLGVLGDESANIPAVENFGEFMNTLGTQIQTYASNLGDIEDWSLFDDAQKVLEDLVAISFDAVELGENSDPFTKLLNSVSTLSTSIITKIQSVIQSEDSKKAMIVGLNYIFSEVTQSYLETNQPGYEDGKEYVANIILGLLVQQPHLLTSIDVLFSSMNTSMSDYKETFDETMSTLLISLVSLTDGYKYKFSIATAQIMLGISNTVRSNGGSVANSFIGVLNQALQSCQSYNASFYNIGQHIVQGMIDGMNSKIEEFSRVCNSIADIAPKTVISKLEIHSPSKLMKKLFAYAGEGAIDGLISKFTGMGDASDGFLDTFLGSFDGIGDKVTSIFGGIVNGDGFDLGSIKDSIMGDLNLDLAMNPVLNPTIDLDGVTKDLDNLFKGGMSLNFQSTFDSFAAVAQGKTGVTEKASEMFNGEGSTNVTFNQYNNSPKALTTTDIYRNTNAQLASMRG